MVTDYACPEAHAWKFGNARQSAYLYRDAVIPAQLTPTPLTPEFISAT
jgi:hypothetical protein